MKIKRQVRFNTVRYKNKENHDHHKTHPAYIEFNGSMLWCDENNLHRLNKPAAFSVGGSNPLQLIISWYENENRIKYVWG
jgi:hypothetical protein